jgi:hypothetical protein
LEEVAVRAGLEASVEVDNIISLIVGDPQGILDEQLRPRTVYVLNIFII